MPQLVGASRSQKVLRGFGRGVLRRMKSSASRILAKQYCVSARWSWVRMAVYGRSGSDVRTIRPNLELMCPPSCRILSLAPFISPLPIYSSPPSQNSADLVEQIFDPQQPFVALKREM